MSSPMYPDVEDKVKRVAASHAALRGRLVQHRTTGAPLREAMMLVVSVQISNDDPWSTVVVTWLHKTGSLFQELADLRDVERLMRVGWIQFPRRMEEWRLL